MRERRPSLLLSVSEAAKLLGIGRSTLYDALKSGECPLRHVVIGKQIRIPRMAIAELVTGHTELTGGPDHALGTANPSQCPLCHSSSASSTRPTWSAALWSSASTESV